MVALARHRRRVLLGFAGGETAAIQKAVPMAALTAIRTATVEHAPPATPKSRTSASQQSSTRPLDTVVIATLPFLELQMSSYQMGSRMKLAILGRSATRNAPVNLPARVLSIGQAMGKYFKYIYPEVVLSSAIHPTCVPAPPHMFYAVLRK